ncbi:MAG: hypothetical protein WCR72_06440 [Bacteroidota bacterium]
MSIQENSKDLVNNSLPADKVGFDSLVELALDMRWSWDHSAMKFGGSWTMHYGIVPITPGPLYKPFRGKNCRLK